MLKIRSLNKELQEVAINELYEVPERISDDVERIKIWLQKQPHINARIEDQWILVFLRACKFSLERTKERLDSFYTIRTLMPEFFNDRNPFNPEIQQLLRYGVCIPLPNTETNAGPRINFIRNLTGVCVKPEIYIKTMLMIQDILLYEDDNYVIAGHENIAYAIKDSPSNLIVSPRCVNLLAAVQPAYPIRIKGCYFINLPPILNFCIQILQTLIPTKIFNRMWFLKSDNIHEMYNQIPKTLLPTEYGGDAGSIDDLAAKWKAKVESYAEWFKEEEAYGTNEKLRPGKPKIIVDDLGVEGSFRKLNFD